MKNKPIAIIGMGCRFPGGAVGPESFWNLLCEGKDLITEVPSDRWDENSFYDPDPGAPGKIITNQGGFLDHIDRFDAGFFGISPREAAAIDPQQRIMMEIAWEALEDAGIIPEKLAGSKTSVAVGDFALDYKLLLLSENQRDLIGIHTSTGSFATLLANRISYWFDFRGPSLSLDTACSSSLVAVHLACRTLWNEECELALAGGVNAIFKPEWTIAVSKGGFLSPDGRCKSFDSSANGYVRSEGAGMVVLKPLEKAEADGDRIYAVIRGSGVNQDGRTNGITVPNGESQKQLMKEVYEKAGISPSEIQYVEAHGTGTAAGDPVEANSIGEVCGQGRPSDDKCIVGSVKSNAGHMEAAAGVAALIKTVLCLHHGKIPPSIHLKNPNPSIDFEKYPIRIARALENFPKNGGAPRIAAVNSFGFGGTNAHVVMEKPVSEAESDSEGPSKQDVFLFPMSAKTPEALSELAESYLGMLDRDESIRLEDAIFSAAARRTHHDRRLAIVARGSDDLKDKINGFLSKDGRKGINTGKTDPANQNGPVFVFSGMGPQWWAMGRELLETEPVFRDAVDRCGKALSEFADWSLWDLMTASEEASRINETRFAQPAIFALQTGLAALWRSWGVRPSVVVGHSVGEIAAAHDAGILSLEDAARVIYHRSRLQQRTAGMGKMLAVGLPKAEALDTIKNYENVSIGAVNSPSSVTLSGNGEELDEIAESLSGKDIFCRFLRVEVPYHSPVMDIITPEFMECLSGIKPGPSTVPFVSTVTGKKTDGLPLDPEYWANNVRQPVLFADAVSGLANGGHTVFLEIGAQPVLAASISECLAEAGKSGIALPSLRRKEDERFEMLNSLAVLYTNGCPVDWERVCPKGRFTGLPSYPWQRERYWTESETGRRDRLEGAVKRTALGNEVHPLLGGRLDTVQPVWESEIDLRRLRYIADHSIQGAVLFPGAAYAEMGVAAARELSGKTPTVKSLEFHRALVLTDAPKRVQLIFDEKENTFEIYGKNGNDDNWIRHAAGSVELGDSDNFNHESVEAVMDRCPNKIEKQDCYGRLSKIGYEYGSHFQAIDELRTGDGEAVARLRMPEKIECKQNEYLLHPVILDGAFQTFLGASLLDGSIESSSVYLPVEIGEIGYHASDGCPDALWCHARITHRQKDKIEGDITIFNGDVKPAASVKRFSCRSLAELPVNERNFLCFEWEKKERSNTKIEKKDGKWLVFSDDHDGPELEARLKEHGRDPILVFKGDEYRQVSPNRFQAGPDNFRDLRKVLSEVGQCEGVVHLWSLNGTGVAETIDNCMSAVHIAKLVSEHERPPVFHICTRNGQCVNRDIETVWQSPIWGLGRVVMNEHPGFRTKLVDSDGNIDKLAEELLGGDDEDEIAFRGSERYVRRLVEDRGDVAGFGRNLCTSEASYLVTGGLGGFGLRTAQWLAEQGARNLVLASRRGADTPEAKQAVTEMEQSGANILVCKADITDETQVAAMFSEIEKNMPPLKGVVHSANVYDDMLVKDMTRESFEKVMKPKALGAWFLHRHTEALPLDFFVMFSSISSIIGNPGQGNYAAANLFTDSLARYRKKIGKCALTINWGAISDTGQAAEDEAVGKHLSRIGIEAVSSGSALNAMKELLDGNKTRMTVAEVNWQRWKDAHASGDSPKFSRLGSVPGKDASDSTPSADMQERLKKSEDARGLLVEYIRKEISKISGVGWDMLDEEKGFADMGFDSMMSLELRNRLIADFQRQFPTTLLFNYPNIKALADYLADDMTGEESAGQPEAGENADTLDKFLDDELKRLAGL